jgi:twitching motility protein PilT
MKSIELLREAVAQGASDIHIVPNSPPLLRIHGSLVPLSNYPVLSAEQSQQLIIEFLTERERARLAQEFVVDFSMDIDQTRYRGNALFQRNGLEAALRLIPEQIPSPESLMLAPVIMELANLKGGLIVVTGPTGAGKSTTLACMIDLINQRRRANIITIEDPIEFIHTNKNCVVSQREIGVHSLSFSAALKGVMRQDPDVVMIGEMRDLETISAVITVAETGHLVLATLHSNDSVQALDRMIDVFEARQQQQIRTQLSGVLKAVISQNLIPKVGGGGRVPIREVLIVNAAVGNLIRSGKNHEIYTAIEMGAREGMISYARSMAELAKRGIIESAPLSGRPTTADPFANKRRPVNPSGSHPTT